MKSFVHLFSILVSCMCIVLAALMILSAQSDASLETLQVGDSIEHIRQRVEFLLDAAEGQTVTLRWEGNYINERCEAPFEGMIDVVTEVTNADGDPLEPIGLLYTTAAPTQVYALQGTASYHVSAAICGGSSMALSLVDGSTISRVELPSLSIGQPVQIAATSVAPDQLLAFPLNVQAGDVFTVDAHFSNPSRDDDYPMYAAVVRDANGHLVPSDFSGRLPPAYIVTVPVYTVDGDLPYHLEFPALSLYNTGYLERYGETQNENVSYSVQLQSGNTAIVDAGLLPPETRIEGILSSGVPVFYTLDVAEGETFTFSREFMQTPYQYFLNAEGDHADAVASFVNQGASQIWVMSLNGTPPYTYYFQGEGSYSLFLESGSGIEGNELGTLATGEALRVTIPPPDDRLDYITLDVNSEAVVTLNWNVTQAEFSILDAAGNRLYPSNDHWNDGYAIVDLSRGTPPLVVSLDDVRYAGQSFIFTLAEGEIPLSPDAASTNP